MTLLFGGGGDGGVVVRSCPEVDGFFGTGYV